MMDELAFKRWLQRVSKNSGEKIEGSAAFLSIFSKGYEREPQCALELGIAVILDKPIYLLVPNGTEIPENVRRLARAIEFFDPDKPGEVDRSAQALMEHLRGL